jgi:hypothetical protein
MESGPNVPGAIVVKEDLAPVYWKGYDIVESYAAKVVKQ